MERNYLEKVHWSDIKSKMDIQTTLVFNISKTYQKENQFSVFHLNYTRKYTETTLIFCPSKSDWKKHRNDVDISLIEVTSNKVRRNDIDFPSIEIKSKKYIEMTWKFFVIFFSAYRRNIDIKSTLIRRVVSGA